MELSDSLEQTFTHAHGVIAKVEQSQYSASTPCSEWTVRDLLEHMIGVVAGMGATVGGRPSTEFVLASDPAAQFQDAARATLRAWRAPDVMDSMVDPGPGPMPGRALASINLLDTATHTWDLATATGQPAELPDAVALAAIEASQMNVSAELRPGRFGPEVPAPETASATDRLVAFLGRTP